MRFKGKISWYLWVIFLAAGVVMLYSLWELFWEGAGGAELGGVAVGVVVYHLIVVPICVRNYVEITDTKVIVCFGFLEDSVELCDIRQVYRTHNPIAATAASLDRIEIVGRRNTIFCAVKEREAFLAELQKRIFY